MQRPIRDELAEFLDFQTAHPSECWESLSYLSTGYSGLKLEWNMYNLTPVALRDLKRWYGPFKAGSYGELRRADDASTPKVEIAGAFTCESIPVPGALPELVESYEPGKRIMVERIPTEKRCTPVGPGGATV